MLSSRRVLVRNDFALNCTEYAALLSDAEECTPSLVEGIPELANLTVDQFLDVLLKIQVRLVRSPISPRFHFTMTRPRPPCLVKCSSFAQCHGQRRNHLPFF